MGIIFSLGNIQNTTANIVVNLVNCDGTTLTDDVFKAFPDAEKSYRYICKRGGPGNDLGNCQMEITGERCPRPDLAVSLFGVDGDVVDFKAVKTALLQLKKTMLLHRDDSVAIPFDMGRGLKPQNNWGAIYDIIKEVFDGTDLSVELYYPLAPAKSLKMKPIFFSPEMSREVRAGHKFSTCRLVKGPGGSHITGFDLASTPPDFWFLACYNGTSLSIKVDPPYRPGDILYVRETWQRWRGTYQYKADVGNSDLPWHPSIHMPREAARTFLRVTKVTTKRISEITEREALKDGFRANDDHSAKEMFKKWWNAHYTAPIPVKEGKEVVEYVSYPWCDSDIIPPENHNGKPLFFLPNPCVWIYEFERVNEDGTPHKQ